MIQRRFFSLLLVTGLLIPALTQTAYAQQSQKKHSPQFELRDGDRVVFLGNTLIERAQKYGHWEAMLTSRYPDRNITFRNLGWDGDTVWAESRGIFDPPAKGYQRMQEHVVRLKPTVIILGYGNNEAYSGEKGIPEFTKQYDTLLADLKKSSSDNVRFAILSTTPHEKFPSPLPNPKKVNHNLKLYRDTLKQFASKRGIPFADLYSPMVALRKQSKKPLTYNGVHMANAGYKATASILEGELFGSAGNKPNHGPEHAQSQKLREAIIDKNLLYFYSWRPQNITYLFLFRKHEQGQNAKEVEEFRRLVKEKEKEITRLKKPLTQTSQH